MKTLDDVSQQLEQGIFENEDIEKAQDIIEAADLELFELKKDFQRLKAFTQILILNSEATNSYLLELVGRVAEFRDCSKEIDAINDVKKTIDKIKKII